MKKIERKAARERQCGSVLSEYVLTTGVIIAALFVPIPGFGQSAIDFMITALNAFQSHAITLLSLP